MTQQNQSITVDQAMSMAVAHHKANRLVQAEEIYRKIIQVHPDFHWALHNLADIARMARKYQPAMELVDRALALDPNNAAYHNTRAVVLFSIGKPDESFAECQLALKLNPNLASIHANLGICYADRGDLAASIASFEKGIELNPNDQYAHDGLGLSLLMNGDLQRGWREQEWRWKKFDFQARRYTDSPHWDGSDIEGRTLFLYIEQGFGDVFQFCRYVPLLAKRGAKVLVEVVPELGKLIHGVEGLTATVPSNQKPAFDFCSPLMSVPLHFGTELNTIPAEVPYLAPNPDLVRYWADYFSTDPGFKIGIAWAGRPEHSNDINRSTKLETFAPLAAVKGVSLYSLQKGKSHSQAVASAPAGFRICDLAGRLETFDDTAAIIANLDLLISVDTSIVHLAGAMAKPVWNIIPFCPDWRWMLNRSDTPWYPTMRLFRLPRRGDWPAVMQQVKASLEEEVAKKPPRKKT
jgi:Tetratricopeptide repeat/Glycosyltransferase family 9 (heptosyltransferase)